MSLPKVGAVLMGYHYPILDKDRALPLQKDDFAVGLEGNKGRFVGIETGVTEHYNCNNSISGTGRDQ